MKSCAEESHDRSLLSPTPRPANDAKRGDGEQQEGGGLGDGGLSWGGEEAVICEASVLVPSHDLASVVNARGLGEDGAGHVNLDGKLSESSSRRTWPAVTAKQQNPEAAITSGFPQAGGSGSTAALLL